MLQFLHEMFPNMRLEHTLAAAARHGHCHIVAYLLATGISSIRALKQAAEYGHLACCRQLLAVYRDTNVLPVSVMVAAVSGGHDAVIELLHPLQIWSHEYMDTRARLGRLDLVTLLHTTGHFACSRTAMDLAATNGHLAVVRFLQTHRNEGCTELAIDGAAGNGHLAVIIFLHEHCGANATAYAVARAAAGGHVEIVRYLHDVMHTPVLDDVPERAARGGNLEVVRYLHEQGLGRWTRRVMDEAAAFGHCDLVVFLHTHRSEGCSAAAFDEAVARSHLEVVRYLYEVVGWKMCSISAARRVIRNGEAPLLQLIDAIAYNVVPALEATPRRFVALIEHLEYTRVTRDAKGSGRSA
ncbi:hypothetical protein SDRG_09764 [Saprolegnia diclina VS20]|uniref:Ankyrin repeat protein n=1 Tax=Saprolegnia diclina (strain VS20) TaxID=1156394 RepID=T0RKE2_SAPDV|nr:hypothetical protein SDRG_09764 [Saprolegnia diclina VS20]EQC32793.1 hypothetical protein SDRG_09764 [Saprolegnia diclina VS20]|eukprot:XP_008613937.1 hypothetical protein SDRG_09764 [Saprolegnia diclina VS20]